MIGEKKKKSDSLPRLKALLVPSHYVYESHTRGSEYRHAFEISNAIAGTWPESVVITGKMTEKMDYPYRVIEVQPHEAVYKMTTGKAILFNLRYTLAALKIMRREKFDVLHHVRPFQIGYTFNLIQLLGFNKKAKFIIGSFSSPYANEAMGTIFSAPFRTLLRKLSILTLSSADAVVVYDRHTKNMIKEYVNENKIKIIMPGVDGKSYKPNEKTFNEHIKFISVGYLIPRKRFGYLIEVFSELYLKNPNISLDIYGDGEQKDYLKQLIKTYKLERVVNLKGFISNSALSKKYSDAHIFISLQEEESFGQVYIEALASGLPVVTTYNRGSNLILNDKIGLRFYKDDKKTTVEGVSVLLQNPKSIKSMSTAARQEFLKKYDSEIVAEKWKKLYVDVMKSNVR